MRDLFSADNWLRTLARVAVIVVCLGSATAATAQVTAEQRKELSALRAEVNKVPGLLREKQLDAAQAVLDEAQARLEQIAAAAGLDAEDRRLLGVGTLIQRQREALARRRRAGEKPAGAVSFSRDVAPIIAGACLNCHGRERPRANLRLDTFGGWRRGGRSGPLVVVGNADGSLLMRALRSADPGRRMPRNGEPLAEKQLQTIATWINQGANYDGPSADVSLAELAATAEVDPTVVIPKPQGTETVSFTRDIAPFMSNLCGRCHSRQRRSGGLCLETFYDMMKGGDSGVVVIPGDAENSRLFRLVGGLENPRMPQGQARITRKNYEDLKLWFQEGCVYDGEDPRTPLRQFVRTPEELEAERFARMSDEELARLRIERARDKFRRALPNDQSQTFEGDEFYLIGNVSWERLREIEGWAQAHASTLRRTLGAAEGRLWKGRLAVFVLKDRFSYDEFNLVIERREAPPGLTGHAVVTPAFQDAYVALLDVGDAPGDRPSLRVQLIQQLTAAYLKRDGTALPEWVLQGLGLALAAKAQPSDPYLRRMPSLARQSVRTLNRPEDVFADGTFSPDALGPVAYTLVDYLLDAGGAARFNEFVGALRSGQETAAAVRSTYRTDLAGVARGYLKSLD